MKIIKIFTVLVLTASLVLPATMPAYAADDAWETPVVPTGTTDWSGTLTGGEAAEWVGSYTLTGTQNVLGKFVCGTPGCTLAQDVYLDATVSVVMDPRDISLPYRMHFELQDGAGGNAVIQEVYCPSGTTCTAHVNMVFPGENMILTGPNAGKVKLYYSRYGSGSWTTPAWTIDISMSTIPQHQTDCDDNYETVEVVADAVAIPVTSETGATSTLVAGSFYRVTVTGLWDDGATHIRNDTAIKQGSDAWMETAELITEENTLCQQNSIDDPSMVKFVFEATATSWAIRVNDLVGSFANNTTGTISAPLIKYSMELVSEIVSTNCASQYLAGAVIGTANLLATNSIGVNIATTLGAKYPKAGDWYIIEVSSGSWKNNGAGEELETLAIKHSSWSSWIDADGAPSNGCYDEDNATYYMQMTEALPSMFVRVADSDGVFGSNTGTLTLTFYSVTSFTRFPSGCELNYDVGDFIETKTVAGTWSNGMSVDENSKSWNPMGGVGDYLAPVRYYMLETYGGPVGLGAGEYSWDADLALRGVYFQEPLDTSYTDSWGFTWYPDDGVADEGWWSYDVNNLTWHNIQTAPYSECVVQLDTVGHVRVFFALDEQIDLYEFIRNKYAFRVRDTGSYSDNSGTLSYRLYQATKLQVISPGTEPETDGCIQYAHDDTALQTITLYGNDSEGVRVTVPLDNLSIYAFDTLAGPWYDNGTQSYAIEVSSDNGDNWYELADYENLLCSQSADGDYDMIYVRGYTGGQWLFRVADGDDSFTNNAGTIQVKVYAGETGIDPYVTCDDSYTSTIVNLSSTQRTVPGNLSIGTSVPTIVSGQRYAIEITGDAAWYESGSTSPLYIVQISDDGGTTWQSMEDYDEALCASMVGNGGRWRIYFNAVSANYRLRVRDGDDDFPGNTGQVYYNLYTTIDHSNPSSWDNSPDPQWVVNCASSFLRPNSLFSMQTIDGGAFTFDLPVPRFGDWIEYGKNAIISFFAWCPEHSAYMAAIPEGLEQYEPFGTMAEIRDTFTAVTDQMTALSSSGGANAENFAPYSLLWGGGGGAEGSGMGFEGFVPRSEDSLMDETFTLDLTPVEAAPESLGGADDSAYVDYCIPVFDPVLGTGSELFCQTVGMLRAGPLWNFLFIPMQALLDMAAIVGLIAYVKTAWIDTGSQS